MTREEFVKGHKADYSTIQTIYNRMKKREHEYLQSARFKLGQMVILTMDISKSTKPKIVAVIISVNLNQKKDLIYHFKEVNRNGNLSRAYGQKEVNNEYIISVNEISVADANIYIRETKNEPENVQCPLILKKLTKFNFKNLSVIDRFKDNRFEDI